MIHRLCLVSMAAAPVINGVALPQTMEIGTNKLVLNGAGLRTKLMFKLYVAGLYLNDKKQKSSEIIDMDEQMGLRLHITSSMITNEKLKQACQEGFENSSAKVMASIKADIDHFNTFFEDAISENDVIDLIYTPEEGLNVIKNGVKKGSIPSLDFKKALFGIWLGDKPADKGLKKALLGN